MSTLKEQREMMRVKLAEIRTQMEGLRKQIEILAGQENLLLEMLGEEPPKAPAARQRSQPIKPVVLDYMAQVGSAGATSKEVDEAVRSKVPSVAQDTVGSVLSRLKSDGALVYDGERYYEKRFAPPPRENPFDTGLRAVN
jgi:hypothetical protein